MGYNREDFLKRIIEVQNITLEHTKRGVSQKWIYQNIIYPRFMISIATYYNYLAYNAKQELKTINKQKYDQSKQNE